MANPAVAPDVSDRQASSGSKKTVGEPLKHLIRIEAQAALWDVAGGRCRAYGTSNSTRQNI